MARQSALPWSNGWGRPPASLYCAPAVVTGAAHSGRACLRSNKATECLQNRGPSKERGTGKGQPHPRRGSKGRTAKKDLAAGRHTDNHVPQWFTQTSGRMVRPHRTRVRLGWPKGLLSPSPSLRVQSSSRAQGMGAAALQSSSAALAVGMATHVLPGRAAPTNSTFARSHTATLPARIRPLPCAWPCGVGHPWGTHSHPSAMSKTVRAYAGCAGKAPPQHQPRTLAQQEVKGPRQKRDARKHSKTGHSRAPTS